MITGRIHVWMRGHRERERWESWKKNAGASYVHRWADSLSRIINFPVIPRILTSSLKSFDTFSSGFGHGKTFKLLSHRRTAELNGRPVSSRIPQPHLGGNYFFPRFPMSISRTVTTHPISTPRLATRFFVVHRGSSFHLFLAVVWLTFRRRNMEKTRAGTEGKIKRKGKLAVSKGASRKVTETRRPPPERVSGGGGCQPLFVSPPGEISAKFTPWKLDL